MVTFCACFFQGKSSAQCITEFKAELRQENIFVKANAVRKLSFTLVIVSLTVIFIISN